jgi:hypothetical protein
MMGLMLPLHTPTHEAVKNNSTSLQACSEALAAHHCKAAGIHGAAHQ